MQADDRVLNAVDVATNFFVSLGRHSLMTTELFAPCVPSI